VLDNIPRATVAGRDHVHWYDASNRLTNVLDGPGGPSVIGLGYDARGNMNNKNGHLFVFGQGNRLHTSLAGKILNKEGNEASVIPCGLILRKAARGRYPYAASIDTARGGDDDASDLARHADATGGLADDLRGPDHPGHSAVHGVLHPPPDARGTARPALNGGGAGPTTGAGAGRLG